MKTLKWYFLGIVFAGGLGLFGGYHLHKNENDLNGVVARDLGPIKAFFSPKGGCTDAIVAAINASDNGGTIFVQAYSFTSQPIEQALIAAKKRGSTVKVILDRSQYDAKGAAAGPLFDAGIEIRMDAKHQIAHNKVICIDGKTLITGSFNFTRQAEVGNAENLLIVQSPELVIAYVNNWQVHWDHSIPYHGETAKPK